MTRANWIFRFALSVAVALAAALAPVRAVASVLESGTRGDSHSRGALTLEQEDLDDSDDADDGWCVEPQAAGEDRVRQTPMRSDLREVASEPAQHRRTPETPPPRR